MIIQNIDIKRNRVGRLSRLSRSVPVCEKADRIRQESCRWQEKMEELMSEGGNAESAGQMEEMIGRRSQELSRVALEEMMQAKADQSGRKCPVCGKELIKNKANAERTIESRFGPVKVSRQRGWQTDDTEPWICHDTGRNRRVAQPVVHGGQPARIGLCRQGTGSGRRSGVDMESGQ
jgi:hypothetical protein